MPLFRIENAAEEIAAYIVADALAIGDRVFQQRMGGELELQIAIERLLHRLADQQLVQILEIGQTLEKEDALHQAFRMAHLVDRFLALVLREAPESPVIEHLRVQKILVDCRQLVRQRETGRQAGF